MRARALIVALVAFAVTAEASPTDELDHARTSFRTHDYDSAMKTLKDLLYPREQLALPADLIEAREMLGACDFELGRNEEAKAEFEKALQIDPALRLDANFFSIGAQHVFDDTRADLEVRREKEAEIRKLQAETERLRLARENLVVVEQHTYALNFAPFGIGQFQNGQHTKGYLFAAGEGVTVAGSFGIWAYLVGKYGVNCPHCVKLADADSVLHLQEAELGLGAVAIGLYLYGVVDAVRNYTPNKRVDDSSLSPDLLQDLDKHPRKQPTSFLHRIQIGPLVTPSGVGIGLGWEN
jgi:tetratricopeptide (TPR) repeat protein